MQFEKQQKTRIYDVLSFWAGQSPEAIAISAPGRDALSYRRLLEQVENTVGTLNGFGFGRNDRVAVLVPNGPEMAATFLGVAAGATILPLSPAYRSNEYAEYFFALRPRAVIVQSGLDSPVEAVSESLGIPIIRLIPRSDEPAGLFRLEINGGSKSTRSDPEVGIAEPEDVALVLRTSGTTSTPKTVPLTNANLCLSVENIARGFRLSPRDRCLNVMPLFHIHGLIAGVLSSLAAGGSIFCTSGPHAPQFFEWLRESRATWYTAAPTVHQAILARGQFHVQVIAQKSLRFIRSCSAPLPTKVLAELEALFGVPVIESYGMTEAAHQVCSNPLPPSQHKPGSVGLPSGVEVAIVGPGGNPVAAGQGGEVVLRGPTVFAGYENNTEANESAFLDGWFRTGDQGYFDSDGYLYLNGRFKELINRAAVKISPREVDEALLDHPSVEQAVTFAIPDPRLGEDVGAAVVLKKGLHATERELREFAAQTLADFKVPRRILIVQEIPKGPTGKLQRIGMAIQLGFAGSDHAIIKEKIDFVGPRTPTERRLAEIWADVLHLPTVGIYNDFFELGGDSILAAQLLSHISEVMQVELSVTRFTEAPTIAGQAMALEASDSSKLPLLLTPIQTSGSRRPFFCVPPAIDVIGFLELAQLLGPDQPFYALQPYPLISKGIKYDAKVAASHYLRGIKAMQPEGPYLLGGHCAGSFAAMELARQMKAQGDDVGCLVLIHPMTDGFYSRSLSSHWQALAELSLSAKLSYIWEKLTLIPLIAWRKICRRVSTNRQQSRAPQDPQEINELIHQINRASWKKHLREPYPGQIDILVAEDSLFQGMRSKVDPRAIWGKVAGGGLNLHIVPGNHVSVLRPPHVRIVAEKLRSCLDHAERAATRAFP